MENVALKVENVAIKARLDSMAEELAAMKSKLAEGYVILFIYLFRRVTTTTSTAPTNTTSTAPTTAPTKKRPLTQDEVPEEPSTVESSVSEYEDRPKKKKRVSKDHYQPKPSHVESEQAGCLEFDWSGYVKDHPEVKLPQVYKRTYLQNYEEAKVKGRSPRDAHHEASYGAWAECVRVLKKNKHY